MIQSKKNLWADGRTDRQTEFHRTLPAKTRGTTTSSPSDCWEYIKSCFKENAKIFSENSNKTKKKTYTKKETSSQKFNQWLKTYKMNINKQKVLNFVLTLEAGGQKIPQNFLRSTWKTEYEKSNNIWIIYWW